MNPLTDEFRKYLASDLPDRSLGNAMRGTLTPENGDYKYLCGQPMRATTSYLAIWGSLPLQGLGFKVGMSACWVPPESSSLFRA